MASSILTSRVSSSPRNRYFEGESHASAYKQYRPKYEETELVEKMKSFLREKLEPPYECALDFGCGSGQSSRLLIPHFARVIGVDCSAAQIKEALDTPDLQNVLFRCGDEKDLGFIPDNSLELITCGESIHWMNLDALYPEVRRILKPGGCLAAYGYVFETVHVTDRNTDLEGQLEGLFSEILGWLDPYLPKETDVLLGRYSNLHLPYSDQKRFSDMKLYKEMTVDGVLGMIRSFSPYQNAIKESPEKSDMLTEYKQKFITHLSKVSTKPECYKMKFQYDLFLVMSRKPSTP